MSRYREMKAHFIILLILLMSFPVHAFGQGIPEEARRYMARGMAAVEMAKSAGDYELAAKEFEQAAKLAPDWPEVYYNLGLVQSKAGDITSAMKSLQRYLDLAPGSPDAAKVREEISKLEYQRDRGSTWIGSNEQTFELKLEGSRLQLTRTSVGDDILVMKMGNSSNIPAGEPLVFSGTVIGDKISGHYLQAAGMTPMTYCVMPERKGDFEGTVDVAAGQMRIVYNRVRIEYLVKFKSLLSAEFVCSPTNRQETPGYVLELERSSKLTVEADVPVAERDKIAQGIKPVADALFAALKAGDYKAATKDFDPEMARALPPEKFKTNQEKKITPVIGDYVSSELKDIKTMGPNLNAFYRAKFTKGDYEVTVKIVFGKNDPTCRIRGLSFDSPQLRQAVKY